MLRQVLFSLLLLTSVSSYSQLRHILVKAGDVQSLLDALAEAGRQNADSLSERLYIVIPNGVYDLGGAVLTPIQGFNVSLIGESMEGTVIRNAPPVEGEGIGKTATLLNRGMCTYVQDLTLVNALDYYHSGAAGRAVCWQDKGNRTIFKRVRMLSYQDTYYSHSEECQHYFEDSEIHGTVDFLCGAGDVYFNRCLIVTEKRNADGSGRNVIAAPRTSTTKWGYVFDHCTIRNDVSAFTYGRGWHTNPRCAWLYTTLESPELLEKSRFEPMSIRSVDCEFWEYHTMDSRGRDITPRSNVITFMAKGASHTAETILTKKAARKFTVKNVFPNWKPATITRKLEKEGLRLKRSLLYKSSGN